MDGIIITIVSISILLSFVAFYIALSNSLKVKKNKVHFYVARDKDGTLWLYLGKPIRKKESFERNIHGKIIAHSRYFENLGLNIDDYKDLKWEDEPIEVFLNLED